MAITQISQVQVRRGLEQDLPQLAAGELGWSTDAQRLYIGNGVIGAPDYAPALGQTEILTQNSILNFTTTFTANVALLQSNVAIIQGNIVTLTAEVAALAGGATTYSATVSGSGTLAAFNANTGIITYTLNQGGSTMRTGQIKFAYNSAISYVSYDEEYTESVTAPTNIVFSMVSNSTYAGLTYTTVSSTNIQYQVLSV